VGIIAAIGAYEGQMDASLKFLVRAVLFSIGMYYFITQLWITNKTVLMWVLHITAWVGGLAALFGLGSLVIVPIDAFPRITAYALFGVAPFGYNHNVLAEFLVAAVPAAFFSAAVAKQPSIKRLYRYLAWFIILIALGTFSRAAWLVLALYGAIHLSMQYSTLWNSARVYLSSVVGVLAMVILGVWFVVFLQTDIVTSSNQNRLLATDIVQYYSMRQPAFGYGPGMYATILDSTRAYTIDFGESLDAHGMMQKVVLEMGYVGLVVWVGLLLSILIRLYRGVGRVTGTDQYLAALLFMMAFGQYVYQLFNTSYFTGHMWWPIGVAMAGIYILEKEQSTYANFLHKT
jgi:O-antigen ligase